MDMNIDINDTAGTTIQLCALIAAVATVSISGCSIHEETRRQAFKAGLVEVQKAGTTDTYLGRPENK